MREGWGKIRGEREHDKRIKAALATAVLAAAALASNPTVLAAADPKRWS